MARDFLTKRVRTGKIIGSNTTESEPKLIVYSDSNASNKEGSILSALQTRISNVGTDAFIYIDGIPGSKKLGTANTVTVFGGDVVVSGSMYEYGTESSMWEVDASDSNNLIPTNTIDGSTGLFAMNFDEVVESITQMGSNTQLANIDYSRYTLSSRDTGTDRYFEFDASNNNNIMPKE
jgi:hypothetical protein